MSVSHRFDVCGGGCQAGANEGGLHRQAVGYKRSRTQTEFFELVRDEDPAKRARQEAARLRRRLPRCEAEKRRQRGEMARRRGAAGGGSGEKETEGGREKGEGVWRRLRGVGSDSCKDLR